MSITSRKTQAAIDHIKAVRKTIAGEYLAADLSKLGPAVVDDGAETKRRITPWFAKAGFGGLLIEPGERSDGFRHLVDRYKPLIM